MTGIDPEKPAETGAEPGSSVIGAEYSEPSDNPTRDLLRSLRSRLAELERSSEPEQSDVASECAALLDRIEQELDSLGDRAA